MFVKFARPSPTLLRFFSAPNSYKAAVLLHGCGVNDGTEITEAVSILINLSKSGVHAQCFAPNRTQAHVVNHLTGDEQSQ
jgi:enhancing lycopene biosynthesis protein 2